MLTLILYAVMIMDARLAQPGVSREISPLDCERATVVAIDLDYLA
jgi:hypothetical protein